jgi:hypothetical protein
MFQTETLSGQSPASPIPRPSVLHTGRIPSRDHRPNAPARAGFAPNSAEKHRGKVPGADRDQRLGADREAARVELKSTPTGTANGRNGGRGAPPVMTPSKD